MLRSTLIAILAVVATLIAVGMLGVASAEAPTGNPVRTVGVEGVGKAPIAQEADAAAANAAYRQAMAAAISDGQEKAQFLASHVGGTLGAVQSVIEQNGFVECEEANNEYTPYRGASPDFGSGRSGTVAAPEAASGAGKSSPTAGSHKSPPKHKKKKKKAKKATVASCAVTASVSLNYTLD